MRTDDKSPPPNRSKFEPLKRFEGSRTTLARKVAYAEAAKRDGRAAVACFLPCSSCGELLPVWSREDVEASDEGRFFCSDCKAEMFCALPVEEQNRRRRTFGGLFTQLLSAFASRDERAIDAVEAEFDRLARLEREAARRNMKRPALSRPLPKDDEEEDSIF